MRTIEEGTTAHVAADVPSRLLAVLVDALVVSVLIFVLVVPVGLVLGPAVRLDPAADTTADLLELDRSVAAVDAALAAMASAAYFALLWSRRGRTAGEGLFGLRVTSVDGGPLGLGAALRRWVVTWGPFAALGLLDVSGLPGAVQVAAFLAVLAWALVLVLTTARSVEKRGLQDRLARSRVTKQARLVAPPDRAG